MTGVVTVVLTGIPQRKRHEKLLLEHLAHYLNKQFEPLDIGTFRLREVCGKVAVDFTSGYDAIEAQNLLHDKPFTLDDGIVHVLRAKVTHDPELMSEEPLTENQLVLYRHDSRGRSHRDLRTTEKEIQAQINMLKIKRKVMLKEENLLERERDRLRRELEELSHSDEDAIKKKKKKKYRKKHRRSASSSSDDSSSSDSSLERRVKKRKLMTKSPEITRLERDVRSQKRDTSSQARASTSRDIRDVRATPNRAPNDLRFRIRAKSGRSRSRSRRSVSRSRRSTSRSRKRRSRSRTRRSRSRISRSRSRISRSRSRISRSRSRIRRSQTRTRRSISRSHRSTSRSRPLERWESPTGRERSLNPVKRNSTDQNQGSSSRDTQHRRGSSRAIENKMERPTPKRDPYGRNPTTIERETTVKYIPQKGASSDCTDLDRKKQSAVKEILLNLQKPLDILCYNESTTDINRRRVLSKVFLTTRKRMENLDINSFMNASDIVSLYNTQYSNTEEELAELFNSVISAQSEAQDPVLNDIDDILQGLDVDLLAEDIKPKIECDDEELEEGEITNIVINIVPTPHPNPTPVPQPTPQPTDSETHIMEDKECGYYVRVTVPNEKSKKYFLLKKKLLKHMNEHILKVTDHVEVELISYILRNIIEKRMNELLVGVAQELKTKALMQMYRVRYPRAEDEQFVVNTLCAIWRGEYNDSENAKKDQPPEVATAIVKQEKLDETAQEELAQKQKQTKKNVPHKMPLPLKEEPPETRPQDHKQSSIPMQSEHKPDKDGVALVVPKQEIIDLSDGETDSPRKMLPLKEEPPKPPSQEHKQLPIPKQGEHKPGQDKVVLLKPKQEIIDLSDGANKTEKVSPSKTALKTEPPKPRRPKQMPLPIQVDEIKPTKEELALLVPKQEIIDLSDGVNKTEKVSPSKPPLKTEAPKPRRPKQMPLPMQVDEIKPTKEELALLVAKPKIIDLSDGANKTEKVSPSKTPLKTEPPNPKGPKQMPLPIQVDEIKPTKEELALLVPKPEIIDLSDGEEPTVVVKKEAPDQSKIVGGIKKEPTVVYVSDDEGAKKPKAQSKPKATQDVAATGGVRPRVKLETFVVDDSDDERDSTVLVKQEEATKKEVKKERSEFVEVSDDEQTQADIDVHSNDSTETVLIANEPVTTDPVMSTDNDDITGLLGIEDTNVETIERIEKYMQEIMS